MLRVGTPLMSSADVHHKNLQKIWRMHFRFCRRTDAREAALYNVKSNTTLYLVAGYYLRKTVIVSLRTVQHGEVSEN